MHWYKTEENLPKPFESVLLYIPDEAPLPTVHEGYYANGDWYSYVCKYKLKEVKYWAEMPTPPEEDSN